MQRLVLDRSDGLDAAIEIARHPVSRSEVVLLVAAVCEVEYARMLEESSYDADHADAIADARDTGPQTADAANDQIDLDSGPRRFIERLDCLGIDERVHLRNDSAAAALSRVLRFSLYQLQESLAHVAGCNDQLSVKLLTRESGQRIEEIAQVRAD